MRIRACAIGALLIAVVACQKSPTTASAANGTMIATVDGAPFTGGTLTGSFTNGSLTFSGESSTGQTITVAATATGPTTLTIGGAGGTGLTFIFTEKPSNREWKAFTSNGSGTLTLTTLTATRAAGTFSFVANPTPNTGAFGTKTVTSGSFDLQF